MATSGTEQRPSDISANSGLQHASGLDATAERAEIVYDVEHLATFSTTTTTTTSTARHEKASNEESCINDNKSNFDERGRKPVKSGIDLGGIRDPKVALQKLFELEKLSGIWTQRMQIQLQQDVMLIIDCETSATVERFYKSQITRPAAFNHYNDIYNNIIVFLIEHKPTDGPLCSNEVDSDSESGGELHIFQCVSHKAQQLVGQILEWKQTPTRGPGSRSSGRAKATVAGSDGSDMAPAKGCKADERDKQIKGEDEISSDKISDTAASTVPAAAKSQSKESVQDKIKSQGQKTGKPPVVITAAATSKMLTEGADNVPIVNVNVKETVQVFNQIAALREKSSIPTSPTTANNARPLSDSSIGSTGAGSSSTQSQSSEAGALGHGAQLYQQRSIRATLAPTTSFSAGGKAAEQLACGDAGHSKQLSSHNLSSAGSSLRTGSEASGQQQSPRHRAAGSSARSVGQQLEAGAHEPTAERSAQQQRTRSEIDPAVAGASLAYKEEQQHRTRLKDHARASNSRQQTSNGLAKSSSSKPTPPPPPPQTRNNDSPPSSSSSSSAAAAAAAAVAQRRQQEQQQQQKQLADQVATNESYVSVLNHCFDDIEKFIIKLQQAFSASRELHQYQKQRHRSKRSPAPASNSSSSASSYSSSSLAVKGGKQQQQQPLPPIPSSGAPQQQQQQALVLSQSELASLALQSRGPNGDDYFEILSKFKLAFNLLAKLKSCIHEPNAPELVHFLFTPLAIIIESARNVVPPVDPTLVGIPYLNRDALELLSNCCTSKESDLWLSLGTNWTQTIDLDLLKASRLPSSFQPIFSDGWAPVISELELIGLPSPAGSTHASLVSSLGSHATLKVDLAHDPVGAEKHYHRGRRMAHHDAGVPSSSHYRDPAENRRFSAAQVAEFGAGGKRAPSPNQRALSKGLADALYDEHEVNPLRSHRSNLRDAQSRSRRVGLSDDHYQRAAFNGHYHSQAALNARAVAHLAAEPDYNFAANNNLSDGYTELQDQMLLEPHPHYRIGKRHYKSSDQISSAAHGQPRSQASLNHRNRRHPIEQVPARRGFDARAVPYAPEYLEPVGTHMLEHGTGHYDELEAMLLDLGPAQTEWFHELKARGALIVRVLFTREANNDKELSVRRGELLEILDDSRNWWKARNVDLQVAHVPHTIVAIMVHYQTLDELLTSTSAQSPLIPAGPNNDESPSSANSSLQHRHQVHNGRPSVSRRGDLVGSIDSRPNALSLAPKNNRSTNFVAQVVPDERRATKAAGAFRYF